jgi:hypothetical protein
MTDQLPVTLDDLKRAIEHAAAAWDDKNVSDYGAAAARADAWRTAFEWRESLLNRSLQEELITEASVARWHDEREEGVRLIREKLR